MERGRRISTTGRVVAVVGIVVLIVCGLWVGAERWIERRITKLMEEPLRLDGNSYGAKVGKVRVNLAGRRVTLENIEISTQTDKRGVKPVIEVRITEIEGSGINIGSRSSGRKIDIGRIEITSPEIMYEGIPKSNAEDTVRVEKKRKAKPRNIEIGELEIRGGNIRGGVWTTDGKECFAIGDMDIRITGIAGGAESMKEKLEGWMRGSGKLADVIELSADSICFSYENGAMRIKVGDVEIDGANGSGKIGVLLQEPQYSKEQFSLRDVRHKDWLRTEIYGIEFLGIGVPVIDGVRGLRVDSIGIRQAGISGYKDRNQPQNGGIKPTFYEILDRLPIGMEVGVIDIAEADIRYEEIAEGSRESGIVTLDDMEVEIRNIREDRGGNEAEYEMRARGMLLAEAPFESTLRIKADNRGGTFEMRAKSGPMRANFASEVTEAIAGIKIVSGEIESADIEITGNYTEAHSTIRMRYENLEIAIMRRDGGKERRFLSVIANDFVLRRNNPEGDRFKEGHGSARRDPHKSFWNYLWKSSLAGITDTVL